MTIISTAIYNNVAVGGRGGGIELSATGHLGDDGSWVTLINSTLSGNSAAVGGGLFNESYTSTLENVTVFSNTAAVGANLSGTMTLHNSLVAGGAADNCANTIMSLGYNLDSGNSCGLSAGGDLTGTAPLVGPLAVNGASNAANLTHALLADSPAIDAGDPSACPLTDQRGVARPIDGNHNGTAACDIGAYEYNVWSLFMALLYR